MSKELTRRDFFKKISLISLECIGIYLFITGCCGVTKKTNNLTPVKKSAKKEAENQQGILVGNKCFINDECIACGACEAACPVDAISEGDPIYKIDSDVCVGCKGYYDFYICVECCPVDAIVICNS